MYNAGVDEAVEAGVKLARRNINNLRYADDEEMARIHRRIIQKKTFMT